MAFFSSIFEGTGCIAIHKRENVSHIRQRIQLKWYPRERQWMLKMVYIQIFGDTDIIGEKWESGKVEGWNDGHCEMKLG